MSPSSSTGHSYYLPPQENEAASLCIHNHWNEETKEAAKKLVLHALWDSAYVDENPLTRKVAHEIAEGGRNLEDFVPDILAVMALTDGEWPDSWMEALRNLALLQPARHEFLLKVFTEYRCPIRNDFWRGFLGPPTDSRGVKKVRGLNSNSMQRTDRDTNTTNLDRSEYDRVFSPCTTQTRTQRHRPHRPPPARGPQPENPPPSSRRSLSPKTAAMKPAQERRKR
ncbi:hypothetical protein C8A03DRAFT_19853 [Achaetomium macrosporum]|uniref:Uncharacterized protein n=1 Tax=Achaetomium macrosporum TaxID=79813 RepID=A0AAN7C0U4_9PEZI|nr:hypothetical protein C8A03DRAFT_19853 [Achaetomium macrosporum]